MTEAVLSDLPGLESIYGQDAAVRLMRRGLEHDSLCNTYLMTGPEGVGKYAVARAFSQAITCRTPRQHPFDACGNCESCSRASTDTHPEIITIRPMGEQIQIAQLWDRQGRHDTGALSRSLNYAPSIGKRRVYIIERAERLTESAANSLLKVLEEPPWFALFILIAPHTSRVLPTIVSRSQTIRLNAVSIDDLAQYLQSTSKLDPQRAATIAGYSEGRIGQAMTLAADPNVMEEIERILDFAISLPSAPMSRALRCAEQIRKLAGQTRLLAGDAAVESREQNQEDGESGATKEKVARKQYAAVFDLLVTYYRDLLAASFGLPSAHLVNRTHAEQIVVGCRFGSVHRWTNCLDALLRSRRRLDANANITLITEALAMALLEPL